VKNLVVILGPTASGKTELAIRVAKWLGTEIISADSRQFYRELSIGTAKPSPGQLSAVPHHFIGHISVKDSNNIAQFEKDALNQLEKLFESHTHVVMCGGSGLYIDAVCRGLDEQPEHDPQIRQSLREQYKDRGIRYLQAELQRLDPEYYLQVDRSNPQRLMRALEVCIITGKPYSSFRKGLAKERPFRTVKLGLAVPRDVLIERIKRRVDGMMDAGLLAEAEAMLPLRHLNALNTVGYKELFDYFDGKLTLDEAVEQIRVNTRRYAKRQMTWFRKDQEVKWIDAGLFSQVELDQALDG
jgi:tRNA dimethylallyltransferase